jgi:peroxiredoxin (alkyl hydroperoxide reductase subunit C)
MSTLVNRPAPDFKATAVMADGSFKEVKLSDYQGKYVLLFFYPLDFTFVCPSEIIAHDHRIKEFEARNVQVIGVSIDSHFSHFAWRNTPVEKGGIGPIKFPLVADVTHEITRAYGVEHQDSVAFRASFLIDRNGIVQHETINNLPLGRNVDEALRLIDALQFTEEHGEVCPAGWKKGEAGMKASTEGVAEYLAKHAAKL